MEKLIKPEGVIANSNNYWKIREKLLGKEEYDTITEDNITITEPAETKNHIADYFENLCQSREGEQTHESWTHKINNNIAKITHATQTTTTEPITIEEVNKCIQQLK